MIQPMNGVFGKEESQIVKGIGIMMLLWHHLFYKNAFFERYSIVPIALTQEQLCNSAVFCNQCLSVFAFVTGYGLYLSLSKSEKSNVGCFGDWIVGRLKKKYSDYWFVFILAAIVTTIINGRFAEVFADTDGVEGCFQAVLNF